jgi:hypothetical protein
MSGYLARLAASVSKERSSIHPLVAPLFASPQETVELPAIEGEQITSPRRQTTVELPIVEGEQITSPRRRTTVELPVIEGEQITSPRPQTEVREAPAEARRREILRPRTNTAVNGTGEPRSEHPAAQLARTRPQGRLASPAPDETSSLSEPASQIPAPPLPNADGKIPATNSHTPVVIVNSIQNAAPFAPAPVRQQHVPSSSPFHKASPGRKPDEVQIHIGRIEVTAVAPSPSGRPPINPARKSPSLDEYLKRGRH